MKEKKMKTKTRERGILHVVIFAPFGLLRKQLISNVNSMFARSLLSTCSPRKKVNHLQDAKF